MPYKKGLVADAHHTRIARRYGLQNSWRALREARKVGIPPALALAMIEQEGGGWNQFGHDRDMHGNYIFPAQDGRLTVTRARYRSYLRARGSRGQGGMQGVGPLQLTWYATQDHADRMGGCWKPRINLRCGFQTLAATIKAHGLHDGIRAYNGTGPKAEEYARSVLAKRAVWHDRLFGK